MLDKIHNPLRQVGANFYCQKWRSHKQDAGHIPDDLTSVQLVRADHRGLSMSIEPPCELYMGGLRSEAHLWLSRPTLLVSLALSEPMGERCEHEQFAKGYSCVKDLNCEKGA